MTTRNSVLHVICTLSFFIGLILLRHSRYSAFREITVGLIKKDFYRDVMEYVGYGVAVFLLSWLVMRLMTQGGREALAKRRELAGCACRVCGVLHYILSSY